jgi:hypothetical protein
MAVRQQYHIDDHPFVYLKNWGCRCVATPYLVVKKKLQKNEKLLLTMKRTRAIINKLTARNADSAEENIDN